MLKIMRKRKAGKLARKAGRAPGKAHYHHGGLRDALIGATRRLVMERGAENFTLADACRAAGVTTAAPYRHFRSKQEILEEIASRGFDELKAEAMAVIAEKGAGTLEAIVAMGQAYVAFAVRETAVFRLMFGQEPSLKKAEQVAGTGHDCFAHLIEQITLYSPAELRARRRAGDRAAAVDLRPRRRLALIDKDYLEMAPQLDVNSLIANATPGLLASSPRRSKVDGPAQTPIFVMPGLAHRRRPVSPASIQPQAPEQVARWIPSTRPRMTLYDLSVLQHQLRPSGIVAHPLDNLVPRMSGWPEL
jgi:AcrR family transcriptional regulator